MAEYESVVLDALGVGVASLVQAQALRSCSQRSPEWFEARKNRITASDVPAALNLHTTTWFKRTAKQLLQDKQRPAGRPNPSLAQQHGIDYEPRAIQAYVEQLAAPHSTAAVGMLVHKEHTWLAASPDSLIVDSSRAGPDGKPVVLGLLEVKCPHKLALPKDLPFHVKLQVTVQLMVADSWGLFAKDSEPYADVFYYKTHGSAAPTSVKFTVPLDSRLRSVWTTQRLPAVKAFYMQQLAPVLLGLLPPAAAAAATAAMAAARATPAAGSCGTACSNSVAPAPISIAAEHTPTIKRGKTVLSVKRGGEAAGVVLDFDPAVKSAKVQWPNGSRVRSSGIDSLSVPPVAPADRRAPTAAGEPVVGFGGTHNSRHGVALKRTGSNWQVRLSCWKLEAKRCTKQARRSLRARRKVLEASSSSQRS